MDGDREPYTAPPIAPGCASSSSAKSCRTSPYAGRNSSNRPLICEQAFDEALDPGKLEKLGRYEVHLDRKLERMLSMLLRLKELRRTAEMAEVT